MACIVGGPPATSGFPWSARESGPARNAAETGHSGCASHTGHAWKRANAIAGEGNCAIIAIVNNAALEPANMNPINRIHIATIYPPDRKSTRLNSSHLG